MPRRSSSSGSSRRSSAPSRSASTSAHSNNVPAARPAAQPPVQQAPARQGGSGLFGQMASTAAGVAVGHTIGNGISNALFGGRGHAEEDAAPQQPAQQQEMGGACAMQAKDFSSCVQATNGDMTSCQYYLDMLKACQANQSGAWA